MKRFYFVTESDGGFDIVMVREWFVGHVAEHPDRGLAGDVRHVRMLSEEKTSFRDAATAHRHMARWHPSYERREVIE